MVDTLYSLVNINERFDRLVIDPLYIHRLDMTIELPFDEIISIYNKVFSRIYENILPRIHNQVNKLTVDSYSIKSILTVNYSQLYSLSLVNFQEEILFQYLKGDFILRNLLSEQITDLNIDIQYDIIAQTTISLSEKFALILSLSKRLTSLNFCQLFHYRTLSVWFVTRPSKICMSSTLTKLKIEIKTFRDCLCLLDGCLDCLSRLIINVQHICVMSLRKYNTEKLPRLKHFSLTSLDDTIHYDKLIIPLLCRMINLEKLILFLSIIRFNSTFIDGIQLYDQFLIYMPRLNKFTFNIITVVVNNNIHLSSHKDIQHSFIGRRYGQA
ncbi:unnamed protein product [Rotaria sordida]|uniref:Uncharacterized protein n=1 Tax=Rotaria sordida TaxID=392033 RepID=A0A816BQE3_9BILA|nr:unnamed protein product [Rotaria sordida]CAF1611330.1 unnamed protein product [Rotaria sordida]